MMFALPALALAIALASPAPAEDLPTARSSIVLHLHAPPAVAFPMFDPVNESRWDPDWHPALLGDGRVAAGLVFTTDDDGRITWLLDRYEPAAGIIRYVCFRTAVLTTIDITVAPDGQAASIATVSFTRSALTERGAVGVRQFAIHFPGEAPHWEGAINAALAAVR